MVSEGCKVLDYLVLFFSLCTQWNYSIIVIKLSGMNKKWKVNNNVYWFIFYKQNSVLLLSDYCELVFVIQIIISITMTDIEGVGCSKLVQLVCHLADNTKQLCSNPLWWIYITLRTIYVDLSSCYVRNIYPDVKWPLKNILFCMIKLK